MEIEVPKQTSSKGGTSQAGYMANFFKHILNILRIFMFPTKVILGKVTFKIDIWNCKSYADFMYIQL